MQRTLVCMLILCGIAHTTNVDPNYNYDKFCTQFDRDYTGQEYDDHKAIFDANYAELLQNRANGIDQRVSEFMDWN